MQSHLKETVEAPSYSFMCLECHLVFDTKSTLQVHSVERHADKHYMELCDVCGLPCKSVGALRMHSCTGISKSVFENLNEKTKVDIGVISRCTICGKIYSNNSPKFQQHMRDHKNKGEMDNDDAPGKGGSSAAENAGKPLVVKDKTTSTSEKSSKTVSKKRPLEGKSKKEPSRKKVARESEDESDSTASENADGKTSRGDSDITGEFVIPMNLPHRCSECREPFHTEKDLIRHMKDEHEVIRQFTCHLCGLTYENHSKLHSHVKTVHEGKPKEPAYLCWLCEEKNIHKGYPNMALLEKHIITFHKVPKCHLDFSKLQNAGSESTREEANTKHGSPVKRLKVEGDVKFTCAKCDFVCEEKAAFLKHINRHRSDDHSIQCQECGMCFVVMPALRRHLLMVHKIRDFSRYCKEAGLPVEAPEEEPIIRPPAARAAARASYTAMMAEFEASPEKEKKRSTVEESNPLECKVCYKVYSCEKDLGTHMRSHGMAFIRSKRRESSSSGKTESTP